MKEKKDERYQRYLDETTPEERAKLEKEGLGEIAPGKRIERSQQKSERDIQAIKLQKLMDNFDQPVPLPQQYENLYEPQARVKPMQGAQQTHGAEYHIFRLSKRKEFAFLEVQKMENELRVEEEIYQEKLAEERKKMEQVTAKKRQKRQKRKENLKKKCFGDGDAKGTNTIVDKDPVDKEESQDCV